MPTNREYDEAIANTDSTAAAAKALGVNESSVRHYKRARAKAQGADVRPPSIPSKNMPVEKIIEAAEQRFIRERDNKSALKWMPFAMPDDLPVALCFMGDPHVDDNGCNWPLLRRDVGLMATSPGAYGVNCGDLTNNWVGKLMALYAEQGMTKSEAKEVIRWLLRDCGIRWLLVDGGNHDAWNEFMYLLAELVDPRTILTDWQAKFKLVFPNGKEFRVDLAHDHKGSNQYNPLHAQAKAQLKGERAHLYGAGHRHIWGAAQHEDPFTNMVYWLWRARGYKYIDQYAENLGFGSQEYGATMVAVIDPGQEESVNQIHMFADVKRGLEYLAFLRGGR